MTHRSVILLLPPTDGSSTEAAGSVVSCGRALAALATADLEALVPGHAPLTTASETVRRLGLPVTALEIPATADPCTPAVLRGLATCLKDRRPAWIVCTDDPVGRHLAAGVAAHLGAACIAGVTAVEPADRQIVLTRAVYGGKYRARVQSRTGTTVITVAPGAYDAAGPPPEPGPTGDKLRHVAVDGDGRRRIRARVPRPQQDAGLADARIVVAAGNGIGEKSDLERIRRLAALLPGAAVAGSRPLCDRGWLPVNRQVGLTGCRVAPSLYLALGISGATQHLAGMSGSGFVVAINRDPRAAIFNHADVGVVEDLTTFLPLLIDTLVAGESPSPPHAEAGHERR